MILERGLFCRGDAWCLAWFTKFIWFRSGKTLADGFTTPEIPVSCGADSSVQCILYRIRAERKD